MGVLGQRLLERETGEAVGIGHRGEASDRRASRHPRLASSTAYGKVTLVGATNRASVVKKQLAEAAHLGLWRISNSGRTTTGAWGPADSWVASGNIWGVSRARVDEEVRVGRVSPEWLGGDLVGADDVMAMVQELRPGPDDVTYVERRGDEHRCWLVGAGASAPPAADGDPDSWIYFSGPWPLDQPDALLAFVDDMLAEMESMLGGADRCRWPLADPWPHSH